LSKTGRNFGINLKEVIDRFIWTIELEKYYYEKIQFEREIIDVVHVVLTFLHLHF
jgi:hypothetical protein